MKKFFQQTRMGRRAKRAFTLIELLLVLVILGILAAVVVPKFTDRTRQAQIAKARTDIKAMEDAIEAFNVDNGRYPTPDEGINILVDNISDLQGWHGPYIKYQLDPWGNNYQYVYPGQYNPTSFDIICAGVDGNFNTEDDIWNQ
jgi:general secretion pathway protein G